MYFFYRVCPNFIVERARLVDVTTAALGIWGNGWNIPLLNIDIKKECEEAITWACFVRHGLIDMVIW